MPGFWRRLHDRTSGALWRVFNDRVLRPVLGIEDSPHAIALGCALGFFVAMTPTVGIQMPIIFVVASLARANRLAGLAMCWISNPLTMVPLYYGYYRLGLFFVSGDPVRYEDVQAVLEPEGGESSWRAFIDLMERLGWPLWVGSLITATILTLPVYPIARRFFERRRARRDARSRPS